MSLKELDGTCNEGSHFKLFLKPAIITSWTLRTIFPAHSKHL